MVLLHFFKSGKVEVGDTWFCSTFSKVEKEFKDNIIFYVQ